jgi:hypothetical protein
MGYPTKVQLIKRKTSEQWYINFPSAVAQAMEFERGEVVEWIIENKGLLALRRTSPPPSALEKKRRARSWTTSTPSGTSPARAASGAPGGGPRPSR